MKRPDLEKIATKLHKIFKRENWKYAFDFKDYRIPSKNDIIQLLFDLEKDAYFEKVYVECGRIKITYSKKVGFKYYLNIGGFDEENNNEIY